MTITPPDAGDPPSTATEPDPGPRLSGTVGETGRFTQAGGDLTIVEGDQYKAGRDQTITKTTVIQQPLPPSGLQVRYSLPADTPAFTGRNAELDAITATVAEAGQTGGVVAIQGGVHAIDGMPGVGKTALAVHVAHRLKDRFPDRQLFIDLYAHASGHAPTPSAAALARLLTAVGVDPRYLPEDLDGRVALWRDRMADQRALLILDNAAGSAQVTPLLPGGPECLVLVTSRRHLGDLGPDAQIILLDVLPPDQAREMFLRLAPRATAEPEAAAEIVTVAGYLPLAIFLLAKVHTKHPSWSVAVLIDKTRKKLLTVKAENKTVAAAFDLSYESLDDEQRRFFRYLGLHPGTEIDTYAAAALAATTLEEADELLDALYSGHLLTEPAPGRYGMHDLIRDYSRALAAAPSHGQDKALGRLLDYYQQTATRADTHLTRRTRPSPHHSPQTPTATSPGAVGAIELPDLPDLAAAVAWARAERGNLLACLEHAKHTRQPERSVAFTAALAGLLRLDGPWSDAVTLHTTAVDAARNFGDRHGQANALTDLGVVRWLTGDYRGATTVLQEALDLYRDLGDRLGQANALNELGVVQWLTDDYPGATTVLQEALDLYRDLGDRRGQANALNGLGGVRRLTGDYPGATTVLQEALDLYRDLGDRRGQANALNEHGVVQWLTGDYPGATTVLQEALDLYRDLGDRLGQANALKDLGVVRRLTGDYPGATTVLQEAVDLHRDLGDRLGQANALNELGVVQWLTGDYPGATTVLQEALDLYRDLGDRRGQANALKDLGVVRRLTGDYPGATTALQEALDLYRDLRDLGGEVEALNKMGAVHLHCGRRDQATGAHEQALQIACQIGSAWDEAHALAALGRCALTAGQTIAAKTRLRQAWQIFDRIGTAEAAELAAELAALEVPPADPAAERD